MAELRYQPRVCKQLKRIPKSERRKIFRKLELLARNPRSGKVLLGEYLGMMSLRAWPYRIIYTIEDNEIVVFSITHRQGAYA